MKYSIVAVGKLKRGFYKQGCDHYLQRLKKLAKAELIEVRDGKNQDANLRQQEESDALLANSHSYRIALDERGKALTSLHIAELLTTLENRAISQVSLLIGGAEGHSDDLRHTCEASWRLSELTLPHELARLVLLEQLYRAETIRANHPYHREG
jgi:23S rRNA (pseudouridine1915-N3)-methyltransferase